MKLKQKIAVLLAVFYLVSIAGVAFNMHFCGGKLAKVALNNTDVACKMCAKMAEKAHTNTCCEDSSITVKVKDNHQPSVELVAQKLFEITLFILPKTFSSELTASKKLVAFSINKAPPLTRHKAINILHCTFRI